MWTITVMVNLFIIIPIMYWWFIYSILTTTNPQKGFLFVTCMVTVTKGLWLPLLQNTFLWFCKERQNGIKSHMAFTILNFMVSQRNLQDRIFQWHCEIMDLKASCDFSLGADFLFRKRMNSQTYRSHNMFSPLQVKWYS